MVVKVYSKTAQGTIEYLVVLAVVVVISLVVAGVVSSNAQTQNISSSVGRIGNVTSGGFSIADAVVDTAGNGLFYLQNNSNGNISITKVEVGGVDNNFLSTQLISGDKKLFSLSGLNSGCSCSGSVGEKKTCTTIIFYTTADGLTKSDTLSVTVDCVSNIVAVDTNKIVSNITHLDLCDVRSAGGYFFNGDGTAQSPYGICDCNMLQDMNHYLSASYILLKDIDCSATSSWNSGQGFKPIGNPLLYLETLPAPFTGEFDGNGRIISNLFIRPPTFAYLGFVGWNSGTITNVGLADVNIKTEYGVTGGIAGRNVGTISNSYVTGVISGATGWDGGIAGISPGTIRNTYSSVSITAMEYTGGISGSQGNVINSYSLGSISNSVVGTGGILGILGSATNSFAAGFVGGSNSVGGLVGTGSASNSYWDITRTDQVSGGSCSEPDCFGVNAANSDPNWAYYDTNQPMVSWDEGTSNTCVGAYYSSCSGTATECNTTNFTTIASCNAQGGCTAASTGDCHTWDSTDRTTCETDHEGCSFESLDCSEFVTSETCYAHVGCAFDGEFNTCSGTYDGTLCNGTYYNACNGPATDCNTTNFTTITTCNAQGGCTAASNGDCHAMDALGKATCEGYEGCHSGTLWTNISGNKYCSNSGDGNWCICRGAGYPWLAWENRSC